MKGYPIPTFLVLINFISEFSTALAQGTAFTYQGRLNDAGNPATGLYDLQFGLYDAANSGVLQGGVLTNAPTPVTNGLFTVGLDFGAGVFTGTARWLEIGVRTNGSAAAYAKLAPRQPLTAAPYAIMAGNANTLDGQSSSAYVAKVGDTMTGGLSLPNVTLEGAGALGTSFQERIQASGHSLVLGANGTAAEVQSQGGAKLYLNHGGNDVIMIDSGGGNVGIGTTNPGAALEVNQAGTGVTTIFGRGADANFNVNVVQDKSSNIPGAVVGQIGLAYGTGAEQAAIRFHRGQNAGDGSLSFTAGSSPVLSVNADNTLYTPGFLGIGTTPAEELDICSNEGRERIRSKSNNTDGSVLTLRNDTLGLNVPLGTIKFAGGPSEFGSEPVYSKITGGIDGSMAFWTGGPDSLANNMSIVQGVVSVRVLQITGGSDVAEPFRMSSKDIPKGSVVIIDEEHAGNLKLSEFAYDKRVAGVVSGANGINPGLSLSQPGVNDGGQNVALSGRVFALADAAYGQIRAGDLLTSSDTPGHCMKVTDHAKAQGAIIGKAMSSLATGRGMVLVLVTLE